MSPRRRFAAVFSGDAQTTLETPSSLFPEGSTRCLFATASPPPPLVEHAGVVAGDFGVLLGGMCGEEKSDASVNAVAFAVFDGVCSCVSEVVVLREGSCTLSKGLSVSRPREWVG